MWEHLFLMVCEVAHTPRKVHETNWRRYVHIRGKRDLVRFLVAPRPVLIVTGHFGNFEVGGYMMGMLGFPTYTIARPLDNPYLDRFVGEFRKARGQHILPKQGSAAQVNAVLQSGGALTLLGDQHAGPKGCWVDFLGRPASCHKALALFTLTSGAPMLVTYAKRTGRPMRFELGLAGVADPAVGGEELAGVRELTQWYNHALERVIRSAPEQYWWLHRRWKGAPRQRRAA
jgi:KDO2-lipid IV(A) lauroyltransferase